MKEKLGTRQETSFNILTMAKVEVLLVAFCQDRDQLLTAPFNGAFFASEKSRKVLRAAFVLDLPTRDGILSRLAILHQG